MNSQVCNIMLVFLSLFLVVQGGEVQAEVIRYKPLKKKVEQGDRLKIRGFHGKVKLVGARSSSHLAVRLRQVNPDQAPDFAKDIMDDWSFSLHKKDSVIQLMVRSPQSKRKWEKFLTQGGIPRFLVEVRAPSIPAQVAWHKGPVSVENWSAPLQVLNQNGSTSVSGGEGSLKWSAQNGSLTVTQRKGQMELESVNARIHLKDVKGDVNMENFNAKTVITGAEGKMKVASRKGMTVIRRSQGRINFENGQSKFKVKDFEGDIKGHSTQGRVEAHLKGQSSVRIMSDKATVSIHWPGSGATVNVGTEDGKLYVPQYLREVRLPNLKQRRGRLRGQQAGSIFVRTETGNIGVH